MASLQTTKAPSHEANKDKASINDVNKNHQTMGPSTGEEDVRLVKLGVEPELKRNFNIWSLTFLCFCNNGTWEAITSMMAQAMTSGGSSSMVWGFALAATGALILSLCISEFASMIPTAGGQYHYVAYLTPPRFRKLFSWYAGFITAWAWILATTSGVFACSVQLQAYIILFTPGYNYQQWHTSVIMIATHTFNALYAIFAIKLLHRGTFFGMFFHAAGFLIIITYLLVFVQPKASAQSVFTDTTNLSGWESNGVAWSLGLLGPAVGFIGWDSSTHMAEEMKNASKDLPKTMWQTVFITGLITFPWVIALMFCIPDIVGVLEGPVARLSPLVQLMYNVSKGSQAATIGTTIALNLMGLVAAGPGCMSAVSRILYSLAREGAFPSVIRKISNRWEVPLNAIVVVWAIECVIACIYIGNSTAFYSLTSGGTVVYMASYAFPLVVRSIWGIEGRGIQKGSFNLGRWSQPLAVVSLVWIAFLVVFLCLPTLRPVTSENANYAPAIFVFGVFILPTTTWFAFGKKTYQGVTDGLFSSTELLDGYELYPTESDPNEKKKHG